VISKSIILLLILRNLTWNFGENYILQKNTFRYIWFKMNTLFWYLIPLVITFQNVYYLKKSTKRNIAFIDIPSKCWLLWPHLSKSVKLIALVALINHIMHDKENMNTAWGGPQGHFASPLKLQRLIPALERMYRTVIPTEMKKYTRVYIQKLFPTWSGSQASPISAQNSEKFRHYSMATFTATWLGNPRYR